MSGAVLNNYYHMKITKFLKQSIKQDSLFFNNQFQFRIKGLNKPDEKTGPDVQRFQCVGYYCKDEQDR